MARIEILSLPDGRDYGHSDVRALIDAATTTLADALRWAGHEVLVAPAPVWTSRWVTGQARWLADRRVGVTVFHDAVWVFPHSTVLAAEAADGLLLLANIDPQYPGVVGMVAGGGALDQIGRLHTRAWGEVTDPAVPDRVLTTMCAAGAVRLLCGARCGRIGGRPMGMDTAVADTDQWEIVRRGGQEAFTGHFTQQPPVATGPDTGPRQCRNRGRRHPGRQDQERTRPFRAGGSPRRGHTRHRPGRRGSDHVRDGLGAAPVPHSRSTGVMGEVRFLVASSTDTFLGERFQRIARHRSKTEAIAPGRSRTLLLLSGINCRTPTSHSSIRLGLLRHTDRSRTACTPLCSATANVGRTA